MVDENTKKRVEEETRRLIYHTQDDSERSRLVRNCDNIIRK
jgi:hypothetical protein